MAKKKKQQKEESQIRLTRLEIARDVIKLIKKLLNLESVQEVLNVPYFPDLIGARKQ